MKLLFDQNISFRVIKGIKNLYPEAKQVRELLLENATDHDVWQYAKNHDFPIVTFDSDFYDLNLVNGSPPKIIWLRIGNTSTDSLINLFNDNYNLIRDFLYSPDYIDVGCLEIGKEIFEI
jgi:predicted nuclease of predicted toxin-antitoxin system